MKKHKSFLAYPYVLWSALFIVIPLILVFFFSFTVEVDNKMVFSLQNYERLINPIYVKVFIRSIILSGGSTIICLLVGYPVAYIISKAHVSKRNTLILLFILPMWMNFLLRTYAWVAILGKNGIINSFLGLFGIEPIGLLPIYTSLSKMDNDLINAAKDLGASNFQVFTKVIFPLSMPGVVSGITMVFMPAVTTFAISRLLGGGKFMLLGDLIEQQFTVVGDWNFGTAISIFMMIVILLSMAVMSRFEDESDKEGGGLLF